MVIILDQKSMHPIELITANLIGNQISYFFYDFLKILHCSKFKILDAKIKIDL